MTFTSIIKSIFTPANIKFVIAAILVYLGTLFPQYQVIANMIAGFLGYNIVITTGTDAIATAFKRN